MSARKRILFVDDEPSIRLTLPPVLEEHGFDVRSAGSVAEALVEINSQEFDALLSDLNIGEEGDGFLIVSAMRHLQPRCINMILTGYPAFETALQAIRHHVDDYLVKPADVEALVASLQKRFEAGNEKTWNRKRLATLLRENAAGILNKVQASLNLNGTAPISDKAPLGRLSGVLECAITGIESGRELQPEQLSIGTEHGFERKEQGHSPSAVVQDFEFLEKHIYEVIEVNLMSFGEGNIVSELKCMQHALCALMKSAVAAYEQVRDKRMRA